MIHELLGFDIRLRSEDYVQQLWNQERRVTYLMLPEIKWPLSIDQMVWPSLFRYPTDLIEQSYFQFNETIEVKAINTRHRALELWLGIEEMQKQAGKQGKNKIQIAVSLFLDESSLSDEYWSAVLDPRLSWDKVPTESSLIGYDVADRDMISGLSNCGYDPNEMEIIKESWNSCLNDYGLFKKFADAMRFTKLIDKKIPSHSPFYVYSLFLVPRKGGQAM